MKVVITGSREVVRTLRGSMTVAESDAMRRYYGLDTDCHAGSDGECFWTDCPQLRDGEPVASGRHCPLDVREDD